MRTINFSDARSNLKKVLDKVVDDRDVTIITRRDAGDVVVMSLDTWNSWKETEYLLSSPANAKRLLDAIARLDAGKRLYRDLIEPAENTQVQEPKVRYRTTDNAKAKKAVKPVPARTRRKKHA